MGWFGTVLIVILCILGVGLIVELGGKLFDKLRIASEFIEEKLGIFGKPFIAVYNFLAGCVQKTEGLFVKDPIGKFAFNHPNLGSKSAIITFMFSGIIITVMTVINVVNNNFSDYLMELFSMFPVFFVISLINGNISFSLAALISTGVSSALIGVLFGNCMEGYKPYGFFNLRRLVSVGYYLVTAIAACELGLILSNLWDWLANVGISAYQSAIGAIGGAEGTIGGLFTMLGCFLAILALLYVAVLLIGVAVKEYIDNFTYGIVGFLVFFGSIFLLQEGIDQGILSQNLAEWIMLFVLLACVFVPDYIRVNKK